MVGLLIRLKLTLLRHSLSGGQALWAIIGGGFAVTIAGSVSGRDRYVKRGGRFVVAEKIDWEVPCSG